MIAQCQLFSESAICTYYLSLVNPVLELQLDLNSFWFVADRPLYSYEVHY